mmetsp:Transcript_11337/g.23930  ORF Transcript_11337/g.23930 Transcript_11337/m.23930 type:complete len:323 (+) Transcript_11337:88-1056(+)
MEWNGTPTKKEKNKTDVLETTDLSYFSLSLSLELLVPSLPASDEVHEALKGREASQRQDGKESPSGLDRPTAQEHAAENIRNDRRRVLRNVRKAVHARTSHDRLRVPPLVPDVSDASQPGAALLFGVQTWEGSPSPTSGDGDVVEDGGAVDSDPAELQLSEQDLDGGVVLADGGGDGDRAGERALALPVGNSCRLVVKARQGVASADADDAEDRRKGLALERVALEARLPVNPAVDEHGAQHWLVGARPLHWRGRDFSDSARVVERSQSFHSAGSARVVGGPRRDLAEVLLHRLEEGLALGPVLVDDQHLGAQAVGPGTQLL